MDQGKENKNFKAMIVNSAADLTANLKSGGVIQGRDGRLILVVIVRSKVLPHNVYLHRLVVKTKKRGLEYTRSWQQERDIYPAMILYSPTEDISLYHELPKYYLADGTPNPEQFLREDAVCRDGFTPLPERDLRKGTVVELSIGGFAVLPGGYAVGRRYPQLRMRLIKKNLQLGKQTQYRRARWYGGVRVAWEPSEDILESNLSQSYTSEGLPVRAAVEKEFLNQEFGASALAGGAL